MNKNKENKNLDFLTNEHSYEKYVLGILGIIAVIYSVLCYFDKFEVKLKGNVLTGNGKIIFCLVLLVLGICTVIISIKDLLKDSKYKNTIFKEIINDYNNNSIKKYLYDEELESERFFIEVYKNNIGFEYKVDNGAFYLYVDKKQVAFSFDYTDDFVENLSDEEIENLPLYEIGGFYSILEYNKEKLYQDYIKFIKENKEN